MYGEESDFRHHLREPESQMAEDWPFGTPITKPIPKYVKDGEYFDVTLVFDSATAAARMYNYLVKAMALDIMDPNASSYPYLPEQLMRQHLIDEQAFADAQVNYNPNNTSPLVGIPYCYMRQNPSRNTGPFVPDHQRQQIMPFRMTLIRTTHASILRPTIPYRHARLTTRVTPKPPTDVALAMNGGRVMLKRPPPQQYQQQQSPTSPQRSKMRDGLTELMRRQPLSLETPFFVAQFERTGAMDVTEAFSWAYNKKRRSEALMHMTLQTPIMPGIVATSIKSNFQPSFMKHGVSFPPAILETLPGKRITVCDMHTYAQHGYFSRLKYPKKRSHSHSPPPATRRDDNKSSTTTSAATTRRARSRSRSRERQRKRSHSRDRQSSRSPARKPDRKHELNENKRDVQRHTGKHPRDEDETEPKAVKTSAAPAAAKTKKAVAGVPPASKRQKREQAAVPAHAADPEDDTMHAADEEQDQAEEAPALAQIHPLDDVAADTVAKHQQAWTFDVETESNTVQDEQDEGAQDEGAQDEAMQDEMEQKELSRVLLQSFQTLLKAKTARAAKSAKAAAVPGKKQTNAKPAERKEIAPVDVSKPKPKPKQAVEQKTTFVTDTPAVVAPSKKTTTQKQQQVPPRPEPKPVQVFPANANVGAKVAKTAAAATVASTTTSTIKAKPAPGKPKPINKKAIIPARPGPVAAVPKKANAVSKPAAAGAVAAVVPAKPTTTRKAQQQPKTNPAQAIVANKQKPVMKEHEDAENEQKTQAEEKEQENETKRTEKAQEDEVEEAQDENGAEGNDEAGSKQDDVGSKEDGIAEQNEEEPVAASTKTKSVADALKNRRRIKRV